MHDLVLRGGTVVDGTGAPARTADVAVTDGRITDVGRVDGEPLQGSLAEFVAAQAATLDAGRVVLGHHDDWLPGFSVPTEMEPIRAAFAEHAPGSELLEPGYLEATPIFAGLR